MVDLSNFSRLKEYGHRLKAVAIRRLSHEPSSSENP